MELGLQIVPGVVEVGPGLLHPIAAPFHCAARSAIKGRVAPGALHTATGSLRAGGCRLVGRSFNTSYRGSLCISPYPIERKVCREARLATILPEDPLSKCTVILGNQYKLDFELQIVLQHVGRIEHLQSNQGAVSVNVGVYARRDHLRGRGLRPRRRARGTSSSPASSQRYKRSRVGSYSTFIEVCGALAPSLPGGLWLALPKLFWQILTAVDYGNNFNPLVPELVQDSVSLHDTFTERFVIDLRDAASYFRVFGERFDAGVEAVNNCLRILRGRPLKIVPNGFQVGERLLGPNYVSH